jgi:hypothetical protein
MALTETVDRENVLWLTIVSGSFRQKVAEGTPGAIARNYVYQEQQCTKHEIHHKNLKGYLRGIEFKTGDFGEQCIVTIMDGDDAAKLTMPVKSRYFIDFAKKIVNAQISEHIIMNPFDFTTKPKDGSKPKQITGVTILQGAAKMGSFYWDGSKSINGAPTPEGDTSQYTSDDWVYFFTTERRFLIEELTEFATLIDKVEVSDGLQPIEELFPSKPKKKTPPDLDGEVGATSIIRD